MATPTPPNESIREGAPIWRETDPAKVAALLAQYDKYLRDIEAKNKLEGTNIQVSRRMGQEIERLRRHMIKLRTEYDGLGRSIQGLATYMQGSKGASGAITRFADGLVGMVSSVDKGTGSITLFGKATGIAAKSFGVYVGVFQVAIGTVIKFLELQDKARIKQAGLMRSFGALSGIGIGQPYLVAAKGLEIAGEAGGQAASALFETLAKMRIPGEQMRSAQDSGAFEDLSAFTVGALPQTPAYLSKLRDVFAKRGNIPDLANTIAELGSVAYASGANIEMVVDQIFSLGEQFVGVGLTIEDATSLIAEFADAVGKAELPMQMVVDFAKRTAQELTTGQGAQEMLQLGAFAHMNFHQLSKEVQDMLQTATAKVFPGKEFKDLASPFERSEVFRSMDKGDYERMRLETIVGTARQLQEDTGEREISMIVTPRLFPGQELIAAEDILNKITSPEAGEVGEDGQKPAKEVAKDLAQIPEDLKGSQRALEAYETTKDFRIFSGTVAAMHKEWNAEYVAQFNELKAAFTEFIAGAQKDMREAKTRLDVESRHGQIAMESIIETQPLGQLKDMAPEELGDLFRNVLGPENFEKYIRAEAQKEYSSQASRVATRGGLTLPGKMPENQLEMYAPHTQTIEVTDEEGRKIELEVDVQITPKGSTSQNKANTTQIPATGNQATKR